MDIVYLPSDNDAPGCYRCLFPGRQLKEKGGHRVILPKSEGYKQPDGRFKTIYEINLDTPIVADVWVLQQRNERLWAEAGVNVLRQNGMAVVADVDDNYLELPPYNPAFIGSHPYRKGDGEILNREMRRSVRHKGKRFKMEPNQHNRIHMERMIKQADLLTVSTPYLAEVYARITPYIEVIRNYVDWDIFGPIQPQYEVERERLRVGYLGTFGYRQADMAVIRDVVPEFLRRHPEVDFVANSEKAHDFLRVPADQRVTVPEYAFFNPDGGIYPVGEKTAVIDVGLVPLVMNGLNQGKSHLKGMEYNACGIPFIATPTESYKDYWCDWENGAIAHTEQSWLMYLEDLVTNDDLRRKMGEHGRKKAEEHSIQNNWWRWQDVYERLLGDRFTKLARESLKHYAVQKIRELDQLLRFMHPREPKIVVEVGSAAGGTFWALAQVASDDATLISIDMPSGSPLDVRDGKDVYGGRDRERMRTYAREQQNVVLIDGDSQSEAMKAALMDVLDGRTIDLLFIDADHRYAGVKRDFELYSPLVTPGGIIGFHDIIKQNQKLSGVDRLWKEVKGNYESREFLSAETWGWGEWGGIGLLRTEEKG